MAPGTQMNKYGTLLQNFRYYSQYIVQWAGKLRSLFVPNYFRKNPNEYRTSNLVFAVSGASSDVDTLMHCIIFL